MLDKMRVRRAIPAEIAEAFVRGQLVAPNETLLAIVSQIEPGMRTRWLQPVASDLVDFVLRNGTDCLHVEGDRVFVLLPGCIVKGKTLS